MSDGETTRWPTSEIRIRKRLRTQIPTCFRASSGAQYLFQVVDLLDVATLCRLQLADVPVLISALLEKSRGANLVAVQKHEKCF